MELNDECKECEKWFEATVQIHPDQPEGFEDWVTGITQCKYQIYLPDGTRTNAKLFMDHQEIFDNNEFTRYLINRYGEL